MKNENEYSNLASLLKIFKDYPNFLAKILIDKELITKKTIKKINNIEFSNIDINKIEFNNITSINNYIDEVFDSKKSIYNSIDLEFLEKELEKNIKNENYNIAKKIHNRISELKNNL